MNNLLKNIGIWLVIGLVVLTVVKQFDTRQATRDRSRIPSSWTRRRPAGSRAPASRAARSTGLGSDKKRIVTYSPGDIWMVGDLVKYGVKVEAKPEEEQSFLAQIFISWFPMLLLIGVWIFFMRQMQGGGRGGAFCFGKSKARMLDESNNTVTFADVAGCDEAKEEVAELVEFLRDPSKFQKLGGRIPRGVLMVGSPGTGKTLLAKAIAGEAKVPFFSISGSDFVEMFVGVGAARVRDMFEQAKKNAPCIVFIDEIDAVGRQRGAGLGGGNDEREQTLNQLLVEMDGFEGNAGVIVIAATNRPDVLDPALLRPGRFDRQVVVPLPDIRGREQILHVHMRKVPIAPDVKAEHHRARHARLLRRRSREPRQRGGAVRRARQQAPGRHGRLRARQGQDHHGRRAALDGHAGRGAPQHRVPRVRPRDRREAAAEDRSGAQGHDHPARPRARRHDAAAREGPLQRWTASGCSTMIAVLFGGRIAEELFMNQMTTGASNDFERATQLARDMVTRYGMSRCAGPDGLRARTRARCSSAARSRAQNMSEETMQQVDAEDPQDHRRSSTPSRAGSSRRTATRSRRWRRRCSSWRRSTPTRSTTSWPASRRARRSRRACHRRTVGDRRSRPGRRRTARVRPALRASTA